MNGVHTGLILVFFMPVHDDSALRIRCFTLWFTTLCRLRNAGGGALHGLRVATGQPCLHLGGSAAELGASPLQLPAGTEHLNDLFNSTVS